MDTLITRPFTPAEPDCIGPIAISRDLAHELNGLAAAAAADDLTPFWVCATELVHRWSRGRPAVSARVIREHNVAVAAATGDSPGADPPPDSVAVAVRVTGGPAAPTGDRRVSFRTALRHAANRPDPAAGLHPLVDVAILISADGERLYLERMSAAAGGPSLALWAETYLELLSSLAGRPDVPAITRPGGGTDTPVLAAS